MIERNFTLAMNASQKPETTGSQASSETVEDENIEQQDVQRDSVFHSDAIGSPGEFPGAF